MNIYKIIFIIFYLCLLVSYFFSETSGNFKRRAINKIALAVSFFSYAVCRYFFHSEKTAYDTLMLVAILFSAIGDTLLLWSFVKGGISFMVGNLCYAMFFILSFKEHPLSRSYYVISFVLFLVLFGFFLYLCRSRFFKIKSYFIPYMMTIIMHGALGFTSMFIESSTRYHLLGIGCFLFMISDYLIAWHKFRDKENKLILRLNSGTYFVGMLLIALSIGV